MIYNMSIFVEIIFSTYLRPGNEISSHGQSGAFFVGHLQAKIGTLSHVSALYYFFSHK